MAYTPRLKDRLHRASQIATSMGHDYVGTEHVLLALLEDPDAIATHAVSKHANPDTITGELRVFMSSAQYTTPSSPPGES